MSEKPITQSQKDEQDFLKEYHDLCRKYNRELFPIIQSSRVDGRMTPALKVREIPIPAKKVETPAPEAMVS